MLIFIEVLKLITTELCKSNSIEWEERIFFHTVMKNRTSLEKGLKNLAEINANISTRGTTSKAKNIAGVQDKVDFKGRSL